MTAEQRAFVRKLDAQQIEDIAKEMYSNDVDGTRLPDWDFAGPIVRDQYRTLASEQRERGEQEPGW